MASDDGSEHQHRAKRMRKGTKSCAECRRRKIKCIMESHRPDVCRDCFERGSECIEQEHAESAVKSSDSTTLKGRVNQLEELVKTLITKLDDKTEAKPSALQVSGVSPLALNSSYSRRLPLSPAASSASPLPQDPEEKRIKADLGTAPVIGLFDNAVVSPQGGWTEVARTATGQDLPDSLTETDKEFKLRQTLLALLPSRSAYQWLIRNYGAWWEDWFYMMPEMLATSDTSLETFMENSITKGNAVTMAYALLNLAMCLQKMPAGDQAEGLGLPLPPHQLSDQYVAQVNRHILSDDDIVGTYEGVGCLIVYAKFCTDAGRPRKAWLAHRRAISFGQLLNLHRKSGRAVASQGCSVARKNCLWMDLYMIDQLLALLLGQPYTIQRRQFDMDEEEFKSAPLEVSLMVRLAFVASKIVDRNLDSQSMPLDEVLTATRRLDDDLNDVEQKIPHEWWQGTISTNKREYNNRIFIRFMHYQIRVFIHMPFMCKPQTDTRLDYHRIAALQASRKMLDMYRVLRTSVFVRSHVCKALDFQAFTAAMLLVLHLLGYAASELHDNWDDWKLVESTIELLRSTTHEIGGKVSEQCVRTLELFTSCHQYSGTDCQMNGETAQVVVPFFGTLTLAPAKGFNIAGYRNKRNFAASSLPTPSTGSECGGTSPGYMPSQSQPFVGFDSYTNPLPTDLFGADLGQNFGNTATSGLPDPQMQTWPQQPLTFNMDLDHDWSWYLGNNETGLEKSSGSLQP